MNESVKVSMAEQFPSNLENHLRQVIAFVVLPNLPFFILRLFLPAQRPVVSLDYLLLGTLAALAPAGSGLLIFLFWIILVLDVVQTFSGIYYFSFVDALRQLGDLVHVSPWLTLPRVMAVAGGAYLVAWTAMRISRPGSPRLTFRVLGTAFIVLSGFSLAWSTSPKHVTIAGSNVISEVRETYSMLHPVPTPPISSIASRVVYPLVNSETKATKIVLIIEEAVGLSNNPAVTDKVLGPLLGRDVATRYEVSRGSVHFNGPTLRGEMRELCQLMYNPLDVILSSPAVGQDCLPAKLRKAGFDTTAVHGFTKDFFERDKWYPLVGFEHLFFREQLGTSAGTCGDDFAGSCDPALASLVHKWLVDAPSEQKQFIYWLTLNSHEPVSKATAKNSRLRCEDLPPFGGETTCNMIRVQFDTNEAIERLVTAKDLPPTVFIVVGDHAPPILQRQDRESWNQHEVPWVVLVPKNTPAVAAERSLLSGPVVLN